MTPLRSSEVGLIGIGEMGSAVARRLHDGGCSVFASIEGRSAASRSKLGALEIPVAETVRDLVDRAAIILSIVPPAQAHAVAVQTAAALGAAQRSVTYVDCNAVAPRTVGEIESLLGAAGAEFLDAGIIGGPPRPGEPGPIVFVSGARADRLLMLRDAGLDVRVAGTMIGSASALKMSYAGITKGLTALCALMQSHARANGLGTELDAVLAETRPDLWHFLERAVPSMYPKAYRWIAEMREIAAYTAPDDAANRIYEGIARFYESVVDDATVSQSG